MSDGFGKYDVYTTAGSIYCYPDSSTLKNRFGILDAAQLKKLESDISVVRQNDMLEHPIDGRFTPNHLCRIHRYMFGDIYPFAGHYRREDIMKGQTRFLDHREISQKLSSLLNELKAESYLLGTEQSDFIARAAYYFAELNYIHPFREGNGRSTREFMRLLFLKNGYEVSWNAVSHDRLMEVMEASVFDTTPLESTLSHCLKEL